MKIVHICLSGPVTDNWNYQDNILTKYHKKLGYDVTIITSNWVWTSNGMLGKDMRHTYINDDGVKMIRLKIKGRDNFKNRFKRFSYLYETIDAENPDILFIHGVAFLDIDVLVRYLREHSNVVAYADNHADFSNSATNWLSKNILHKIIWRHYAQMLVPYVRKFYGVLPVRVDFLTSVYGIPKEKCELLVMGADDDAVKEASKPEVRATIRKKYGISSDDFLIMTGGKIDLFKTQTLKLMSIIKKIDSPKVKLIVFGSVVPELKEKVEELSDGKKVQYIGWVQSKDTYRYFAAADLVVFPGRHSVFWEQVAGQGIPMIVKDWPGTHHVDLGGNVQFVLEDCMDEIEDRIKELIEKPDVYKEMKSIAGKEGTKRFSYKEIARRSIGL